MSYTKTQAEIQKITEGGKIMGEVLQTVADMVAPGVSAYEIDEKAEALIKKAGGRPAFKGYQPRGSRTPFPSTVCACVNDEIVHGIATKEKIFKDGDIVSLDIGMEHPLPHGFYTDTALTVPVGTIDEKTKQLLSVTKKSLELGIEQARVGNTIASIGKAIQEYIEPQGYGIVRDLVGHGVGHKPHEEPPVPNYYSRELENWELKPGVVIAIEPMITIGSHEVETQADGWTISTVDKSLNAHFEHTVIVTDGDPVVATRRPGE